MTRQELEKLTSSRLDALHREPGDQVDRGRLTAIGRRHYERLRGQATIFDFIPLLVYRSTKDELLLATPECLHDAA